MCFISLNISTLQHVHGNSPLKLIQIIKKILKQTSHHWLSKMSNNKFVELCDQAYLIQTATLTSTQAVRLLRSSANQTTVLPNRRYSNEAAHVLDESAEKRLGTNNTLGNYGCWERIILRWILTTRTYLMVNQFISCSCSVMSSERQCLVLTTRT